MDDLGVFVGLPVSVSPEEFLNLFYSIEGFNNPVSLMGQFALSLSPLNNSSHLATQRRSGRIHLQLP